jgi:DNA-binding transcriptional regulator YhcF (GntR family)
VRPKEGAAIDYGDHNGHSVAMTMLSVSVDQSDPTTLHDQVAAEIRRAIAAGEAAPGDRLPPAKDFAAVLGVNSNTVLRAFHQLREEGLLEFRRGKGITVAGAPERGLVLARARELVSFARSQGVRPDELAGLIEQIVSKPSINGTGQ